MQGNTAQMVDRAFIAAVRSVFADAMGLAGQRPNLVLRFGRGPALARSLRRPVQAVLI